MPTSALTPALALEYLDELSIDVRAAVLLADGAGVAASSAPSDEAARELGDLVRELFKHADAAAGEAGGAGQVEVGLPAGAVFAARERGWTIAVVANRYALPSLMFYDLRKLLCDLAEAPR